MNAVTVEQRIPVDLEAQGEGSLLHPQAEASRGLGLVLVE